MKKFSLATASALALAVCASPSYALTPVGPTTLVDDNPNPLVFHSTFDTDLTGVLANLTSGVDYVLTLQFVYDYFGSGNASGSSTFTGGNGVMFDGIKYNGAAGSIFAGGTIASVMGAPVAPADGASTTPLYNVVEIFFHLVGSDRSDDQFNGQVSATAVPEPMTWMLMLLGFGAIGMAMRRKNGQRQTQRVRYSF